MKIESGRGPRPCREDGLPTHPWELLAVLQPVSEPGHGLKTPRLRSKLMTQAVDLHVYDAIVVEVLSHVAPSGFEELLPREDVPGVFRERSKNCELARLQSQWLPIKGGLVAI